MSGFLLSNAEALALLPLLSSEKELPKELQLVRSRLSLYAPEATWQSSASNSEEMEHRPLNSQCTDMHESNSLDENKGISPFGTKSQQPSSSHSLLPGVQSMLPNLFSQPAPLASTSLGSHQPNQTTGEALTSTSRSSSPLTDLSEENSDGEDYQDNLKCGNKRPRPYDSEGEDEVERFEYYDDADEMEDNYAAAQPVKRLRGGARICARKSRRRPPAALSASERRDQSRGGPEGLGSNNDANDPSMEKRDFGVYFGYANTEGTDGRTAGPDGSTRHSENRHNSVGVPAPENPVLSAPTLTLLSALASVCRDFVQSTSGHVGVVSSVPALAHSLFSESSTVLYEKTTITETEALLSLATKCISAEHTEANAHFHYWVTVMMFASGVNRRLRLPESTAPKTSKTQLFEALAPQISFQSSLGPKKTYSARTLHRYMGDGTKVAALCAAGSFHMLLFLSCTRMRSEFRKIKGENFLRLTKAIRCPPDSPIGRAILQDVIPAILYAFQLIPLHLRMIFPSTFLEEIYGTETVDCTDLLTTDEIFEAFAFNDFIKARDLVAWKPALQPLAPIEPRSAWMPARTLPSLSLNPQVEDVVVINTNFDPSLNTKTHHPRDHKGRFDYTETQREYAEQAVPSSSVEDFGMKLAKQLEQGKKKRDEDYIRLDGSAIDGKMVRIEDVNNDLLALIIGTMPQDLRLRLVDIVNLSFGMPLRFVDSKLEGFNHIHQSVHVSRYNRFALRGDGSFSREDPVLLQRKDKKKYVNTSQYIPRSCHEMNENVHAAEILNTLFEPVHRWMVRAISVLLPEHTAILQTVIDILPGGDTSDFYPFTSCVVNLNSDDTVGGELCMVEPGIVLALRNGDMVVFASGLVSHYNTHYRGQRASMVFQTDQDFDAWVRNRNGWAENKNFKGCNTFSYYSSGGGYDNS
ncbi:hypothetical protein CPB83DRAFT_893541 [Crepidotus variabilis]|uniref:Uncharacterized protein n=1 Tax=Crepidotus variabilis TaxID=179855 RepID=A0A9P6EH04_9AGAR|nr:hypothetical protein CPB83DRAFT_893541 [Crepidotus variabilis]